MKTAGERIIDAIINGALCHASCATDPAHNCVVVWSSGAAEQLDAIVSAALAAKDAEMVTMLGWIANKMMEPEWDSFKKAIAVTDHWKARAEKAEAELAQMKQIAAERLEWHTESRRERDQLRGEVAEVRRKLAEATAEIATLRRVLARIQHESGDQFACEMAKAALK